MSEETREFEIRYGASTFVDEGEEITTNEIKLTPEEATRYYGDNWLIHNMPEYSDWQCYMFGNHPDHNSGFLWTPVKGKEPNWFWRWMQYICFGNKWVKREAK